MNSVSTSHGDVPLDKLVKRYEAMVAREKRHYEQRKEFLSTDEGKQWNREKAKSYYERNRDIVLARRKAAYQAKKLASSNTPVAQEENWIFYSPDPA